MADTELYTRGEGESNLDDSLDAINRVLGLLDYGVDRGAIYSALSRSTDIYDFRQLLGLLEDLAGLDQIILKGGEE